MLKWVFILLGLVFLWGGIDNHFNYSDPVSENPEVVDAAKLKQMIAGDDRHYVSFAGRPDQNGRVYSTHLEHPAYTKFPPWDIQAIHDVHGGVSEYMGAVVEVSLPASGSYLELETMRVDEDGFKTVSSIRLMAPLAGSNRQIWVFSPPFRFDKEAEEYWLERSSFSGRLSKMKNLNRNYDLRHELSEIRNTYAREGAGNIPFEALMIDTWMPYISEKARDQTRYLVAVEGSGASLFVETTKEHEAGMLANHVITGVLQARESRFYPGMAEALGIGSLPSRIGIVSMQSGEDANEEDFFYTKVGIIGGIIFLGLGVLIFRRQMKK